MGNSSCCNRSMPYYKYFEDCESFSQIKSRLEFNIQELHYEESKRHKTRVKKNKRAEFPIASSFFIKFEMLLLKMVRYTQKQMYDFEFVFNSEKILQQKMKKKIKVLKSFLDAVFEASYYHDIDKITEMEKDFFNNCNMYLFL